MPLYNFTNKKLLNTNKQRSLIISLKMTRSSVMTLMDIPIPEERRISKFPKYYNDLYCSPYENDDFSRIVREKCKQDQLYQSLLKVCKIIVIGDVCVGKTCLVNRWANNNKHTAFIYIIFLRFCQKIFNSNYKSTIGVDFEVERFSVLNIDYTLQMYTYLCYKKWFF